MLPFAEYANELSAMKDQLAANESRRYADDKQLETMQMIVQSATEQKLELTTRIEHLERQLTDSSNRLNDANEKLNAAQTRCTAFEAIEIEYEGQKHQIKRLTEENEEQEMDLRELDAKFARVSELSQRQTQELLQLEQSVDAWKQMEADYERIKEENQALRAAIDASELTIAFERLRSDHEETVSELEKMRASVGTKESEQTAEVENLTTENKRLKDQINEQQQKLGKYKSKVIEFAGKLKVFKQCKQTLLDTVLEYSVSVTNWQRDISAASKQLLQQVNKLQTENESSADQLRANEETIKELQVERDNLSSELQELLAKCMESDRLEQERADLMAENAVLKKEVEKREKCDENQTLAEKVERLGQELKQTEDKRAIIEKQNEDLLAEMRELNDALKNRGNVISKQTNELEMAQAQQQKQSACIAQLEEALREKVKALEQLKAQCESQSDILSTSTMSRAEDVARMRDIEDSFEEKYNKLRGLAIKQKKKIVEQQAIIAKLEKTATEAPSVAEVSGIKIQSLKSLQAENDRLMDKIDALQAERKEVQAASKKLIEKLEEKENELKSLRLVNEDAQAMADTHYKTKCALDEAMRNEGIEKEQLRAEIKRMKDVKAALETEITKNKGSSHCGRPTIGWIFNHIILISQICWTPKRRSRRREMSRCPSLRRNWPSYVPP